jgi:hypothetical protein
MTIIAPLNAPFLLDKTTRRDRQDDPIVAVENFFYPYAAHRDRPA